jgi:aminoglycoside phosphotransferase (APT) family kinase protein
MATIGHPLSDLANLFTPYTTAAIPLAEMFGRAQVAFKPGRLEGLPTKEQNIAWYREVAGWDPAPDMTWGDAFGVYRGTIIMQGIAARYAMRVASSAKAKEYAVQMQPFAEVAWSLIENWKRVHERASL